jgi:hypothetical protein
VVYLSVVWSGPPDAGEAALAPLRALATPMSDTIAPKPYPDLFSSEDADEGPTWAISSRALFLDGLDDAMIDVIERWLTEPGAPEAIVQLRVLGGAMARVPGDWTAAFRAELPANGPATYVNFMGDEGPDAVGDAYPASSYTRLRELKRRYDPDNLFRGNHNIRPA